MQENPINWVIYYENNKYLKEFKLLGEFRAIIGEIECF